MSTSPTTNQRVYVTYPPLESKSPGSDSEKQKRQKKLQCSDVKAEHKQGLKAFKPSAYISYSEQSKPSAVFRVTNTNKLKEQH